MSVIILGGNECMTREYINLCGKYHCKAKVYHKMTNSLKNIGSPDLLVMFTDTVSHTMVKCAMSEIKAEKTRIARSHSSSMASLRKILEHHLPAQED